MDGEKLKKQLTPIRSMIDIQDKDGLLEVLKKMIESRNILGGVREMMMKDRIHIISYRYNPLQIEKKRTNANYESVIKGIEGVKYESLVGEVGRDVGKDIVMSGSTVAKSFDKVLELMEGNKIRVEVKKRLMCVYAKDVVGEKTEEVRNNYNQLVYFMPVKGMMVVKDMVWKRELSWPSFATGGRMVGVWMMEIIRKMMKEDHQYKRQCNYLIEILLGYVEKSIAVVTLVNRKRWIEDEWEKVIEYQYDEKGQENVVREVGQRISKKYEGYMNMEMELWLHLYRIMSRMVIESERLTEKEKDILRDQKEGMIYGVLYMNHGRIFYKKMIKDVYKWMMEGMKDRMVHYSLRNLSNNEIRVDEQKILYPLKENYVDIVMRMCEEVEKRKKSELKAMMMDKVAEKMGESVYQDQKGVRTWVESLRFEEEKKRELGKEVREEGDILASLWDKFKKWREEGKSKDEMMALKEEVMKFKSSLMETQQRMKDAKEKRILDSINGKMEERKNVMPKMGYENTVKEMEGKLEEMEMGTMEKGLEDGVVQLGGKVTLLPVIEYADNDLTKKPVRMLFWNVNDVMEGNKRISDSLWTVEDYEKRKGGNVQIVVSGMERDRLDAKYWRIIPFHHLKDLLPLYGEKLRNTVQSIFRDYKLYDTSSFTTKWLDTSVMKKKLVKECGGMESSYLAKCERVVSMEGMKK